MELLQRTSPLIDLYVSLPESNHFALFDIGCSDGIDPVFLQLGEGFRALAVDASVDEIERLRNEQFDSRVQYIDGLVGLPAGHLFLKDLGDSPYWNNSPFPRTSAQCSIDARVARNQMQNHTEKRKNGFDLFGLTVRPYSIAALPFRFQFGFPAQTFGGRPVQGDALYVRDVCSAYWPENLNLSAEKLINLILIYSLFGLPDCGGEVILKYRDILSARIDVNVWLDALTRQSLELQGLSESFAPGYSSLIEKYRHDSPDFYGSLENVADESPPLPAPRKSWCSRKWSKLKRSIKKRIQ